MISSEAAYKPIDRVNRQFPANCPNQLRAAGITYVATWSGFVYVAFVIDVFTRYPVGWRGLDEVERAILLGLIG